MNTLKSPMGTAMGRGCLILFGAVWILFSCIFLFGPLGRLLAGSKPDWISSLPMAVFSLLFITIGLGMIAFGIFPWIAGIRISKPEVTVSSTSLRVGDSFTIGYSQTFKHRTDVKGVRFSLLQRETAIYQSGKSMATVTHDETAAEFEYPGQRYEAGDSLVFSRSMEIPRDWMHSFRSTHNSVTWLLQAKVNVAGWPDYREDFEIQVQPFLAR
jgi:hypothetical protein